MNHEDKIYKVKIVHDDDDVEDNNLNYKARERELLIKSEYDNYRDIDNLLLSFSTTGFVLLLSFYSKEFLYQNGILVLLTIFLLGVVIICTLGGKLYFSQAMKKRREELDGYYEKDVPFTDKYFGKIDLLNKISIGCFISSIILMIIVVL